MAVRTAADDVHDEFKKKVRALHESLMEVERLGLDVIQSGAFSRDYCEEIRQLDEKVNAARGHIQFVFWRNLT